MKSKITLICTIISIFSISSQNVRLSITNPKASDNSEVWFCRSIDGDPINYVVKYDKETFKKGVVVKSFSVDTTMFIMIADNPFLPKIRLVVCKNDSIDIQVNQDTITHKTTIHFSGSNSKGNENFYSNSLFLGGKTSKIVYPIIKNAMDLSDAINQTEQLKASLFSPMDSLFKAKEISKEYYQYVKLEGESEFLNAILSITNNFSADSGSEKCSMKERDLKDLQIYYCKKYDPFSDKYRNVNYRNANASIKCVLINNGVLPEKYNLTDLKLWDKENSHYRYASQEIQERLYATDLIFKQKFGMISEVDATEQFNHFRNIFPKSIFLPVIKSSITPQNKDILPLTLTKYNSTTNVFDFITTESMISFPMFIKRHFAGRAVLVDMWATYCSPCKLEFAFAKDVQTFLLKHDIDLLYFSVDNGNNGLGWVNDIKRYNLNGYHYFATDKLGKYLNTFLNSNLSIPRYLLFDKNGNLVDGNLPKPSEKEVFYNSILTKLNY